MTDVDPALERRVLDLFDTVMALPEGERRNWIDHNSEPDSPLRRRLLALIEGDRLANLRTGGARDAIDDEPLPDRIGAYRIVGRIGRGGMGAVYRGERMTGDFSHNAAIKVIKPGLLSERLIERFQRERQTLAGLAHPNIAQLFDGGATEAGNPFIVMELVDGMSLGDWIETAAADPASRIAVFLAICDAVGFAHQNLIIHRDITLSNILVTPSGVPKLIDFGISRAPATPENDDRPRPPSRFDSLSLTPGFAAPERVAGEAATTLSDIYSLGVVLDRLFPAPRARDIAAIVDRARADAPDDRYPSADALADDVKAWRDGRPVSVRAGDRSYVARRFVARNRVIVGTVAASVVGLVAALVFTLIANQRAEMARAEAERRFEQTRAIAKTMMFDAYGQVSRVPGSTRARETLARASLRYLDALAADPDAPFEVRVEAGQGYARLADVIGSGGVGTLGKLADGNVLLDRAQAILDTAHADRPADATVRRALASLLVERARVALFNANDVPRAHDYATRALGLAEPEARRDAEGARLYAAALSADGEAFSWNLNWADAKGRYQTGERFIAGLPSALQSAPAVQRVRAANLRLMGEAHHKLLEKDAARAALDRAVVIHEALLTADRSDPVQRRAVVASNRYRAVVHRANGRDALAATSIARAVEVATVLRDADPSDAAAAHLWLLVAEVQAQVFMDAAQYDRAFALNDTMVAGYRRLVSLAGDATGMRRSFSAALRTIGGNFYNGGAFERACTAWVEADGLLKWVAANGGLTETDRNRRKDIDNYLARACNPPRQGLGAEI